MEEDKNFKRLDTERMEMIYPAVRVFNIDDSMLTNNNYWNLIFLQQSLNNGALPNEEIVLTNKDCMTQKFSVEQIVSILNNRIESIKSAMFPELEKLSTKLNRFKNINRIRVIKYVNDRSHFNLSTYQINGREHMMSEHLIKKTLKGFNKFVVKFSDSKFNEIFNVKKFEDIENIFHEDTAHNNTFTVTGKQLKMLEKFATKLYVNYNLRLLLVHSNPTEEFENELKKKNFRIKNKNSYTIDVSLHFPEITEMVVNGKMKNIGNVNFWGIINHLKN